MVTRDRPRISATLPETGERFQGALPRIINEAGRPQVGKGWGSAKHPDCSGFTVAQFQSLDLSNVDFSDFYSATLDKLVPPGAGGV